MLKILKCICRCLKSIGSNHKHGAECLWVTRLLRVAELELEVRSVAIVWCIFSCDIQCFG